MKHIRRIITLMIIAILTLSCLGVNSLADQDVQEAQEKKYSIYVNRTQNVVMVFEVDDAGKEILTKCFVCSTGRAGHATPTGTYKTDAYYDWHLMVDGSYGRYCVRFNNKILFHSVPYLAKSKDALEWDQYNLLGQKASLGCVRLALCDAKWIYENCKAGTKVVVYDDKPGAATLYKPEAIKIPEDSPYRGWDPTDDDPDNPWLTMNIKTDNDIDSFDYIAYADLYPDLKEAFGYNKDALYMHYLTYGKEEGRYAVFTEDGR